MLAWKAAHSGNRPSVGKPKLPAGPKGVPEDAVRERRERRRHACMEGGAQRESGIGWKTEASGRAEGRAGRRRPGEERGGGVMLAPLKG